MFTLKPTGGTLPIDWAFPPKTEEENWHFFGIFPPICIVSLHFESQSGFPH